MDRYLESGVNGHGGRALVIAVFGVLTLGHHDVPVSWNGWLPSLSVPNNTSHRRRQRFWSRPSVNLSGHVNGFQIVSGACTTGVVVAG
jgi:hypothetical protein